MHTLEDKPRRNRPFRWGLWAGAAGAMLTLASLAAQYGFPRAAHYQSYLHAAQITGALLVWAGKLYAWLRPGAARKISRLVTDFLLLALLAIALLFLPQYLPNHNATQLRWASFHVYLLIVVILYVGRFAVTAAAAGRSPARTLLISFAGVIGIGSILLLLPAATTGNPISFTDAVFTSTSATCVTGLIVRDTGSEFSRLGQTVILALIQAGGLGIMIFGSLFALLLGSRLSLRESVAMRDIMNEQTPGRIGRLVVFICLATFALEAIGAAAMLPMWQPDSPGASPLYRSIFHAISAFCNAGFSLQTDSLIPYRHALATFLVICPLIVLGGLGFPVLENLTRLAFNRIRRHLPGAQPRRLVHLSLHTRIALITTAILIVAGCLVLTSVEWLRGHGQLSLTQRLLDGIFLSVTSRTAGFNTTDTAALAPASKLFLVLLMSIGGSPSSTAGGIKTVTLAVLVLSIYTTMRRREQVQCGRRAIPTLIVRRAATLIILYGTLFWLLTLLLTLTEGPAHNALDLMFEVASALGTVGLSTGITPHLTLAGKWVIIVAMFVGRLGPLSLLAALTMNVRPLRYQYPEEPLVVG